MGKLLAVEKDYSKERTGYQDSPIRFIRQVDNVRVRFWHMMKRMERTGSFSGDAFASEIEHASGSAEISPEGRLHRIEDEREELLAELRDLHEIAHSETASDQRPGHVEALHRLTASGDLPEETAGRDPIHINSTLQMVLRRIARLREANERALFLREATGSTEEECERLRASWEQDVSVIEREWGIE